MKIKEYKLEIEGLQRQNLELEERNNNLYNKALTALRKVSKLEAEKAELANCINNYVNKNIEANKGLIPESILNDMYKLEIELLQKHEVNP